MSKLATRSREAARRRAAEVAPEHRTVQLVSGSGAVHAQHAVVKDMAFPACRTGAQTRRATRYTHTTDAVNCAKCLEGIAEQERANAGARAARENNRPPVANRSQRNGARQEKANAQAQEIISDETAKVLAKRDDQWASERKSGCSDEDYALAVQVRTLRAAGGAWWAIAHTMGLKGSGPSVKLGKTGAAHARRLWEKAWGKTYTDTSVPRETKAIKKERALTEPGKPWFPGDATDLEIVDAVQGHEITWVCRIGAGEGVVTSVQKAVVKPQSARVVLGPRGRVLNFFEMVKDEGSAKLGSGPQRSVYVDRIEKVAL